ncbi:MAG: hypothetical protein ABL923_00980 [Burkholderiaceae bacterium]
MSEAIEIYIRPSGDKINLNFYIPEKLRKKFIKDIQEGTFETTDAAMHLEFSVLPAWLSEEDQRAGVLGESEDLHIRLPLSAIHAHFSD